MSGRRKKEWIGGNKRNRGNRISETRGRVAYKLKFGAK